MSLLSSALIAEATGLVVVGDGQAGLVERALKLEGAAVRDARVAVGESVYGALLTDDYTTASAESADEAERERADLYALYLGALARLAASRLSPLVLSARLTSLGGAQVSVGEGDREARLMSVDDARKVLDDFRLAALADLAGLALAVGDVSPLDDIIAPPEIYIC